MANEYTFERRVIYTEYEYVTAETENDAWDKVNSGDIDENDGCLLYTSPSPRD